MPDNNFRFAFDFFFTDLPNHVEFLKWSRRLRKDDDILLVAALEAMYLYYTVDEDGDGAGVRVEPRFWDRDFDAVQESLSAGDARDDHPSDRRHAGATEDEKSGEEPDDEDDDDASGRRRALQRGQSAGMANSSEVRDNRTVRSSSTETQQATKAKVHRPMLDNKHPYNLLEIYANLKKLDNRGFNAIEAAYLDGGWRAFKTWRSFFPKSLSRWTESKILIWKAFLSIVSQFTFAFILFFWHSSNGGVAIFYEREKYALQMIISVAVISTFIFYNIATKQCLDALDFNSIDGSEYWTTLDSSNFSYWLGKTLLLFNYISNVLLGPPLVLFNLYFVMTSPDPTEGILNAVALAFVLEIDDLLAPSWDEDRIEDAEANLFHAYISSPFPGDNEQFQSMRFTRTPPGPIPYRDGDKLYIKVPEELELGATEFYIAVFRSSSKHGSEATPTSTYQTISYKVSGNSDYIRIFHGRVREFYCLANFDDFKVQAESMAQMLIHHNRQSVRASAISVSYDA